MANQNIPKLRFNEFDREWEEEKLDSVSQINPSITTLPENFIYIDLESVEKGILKLRKKINKNNSPSRAQRVLQKKDILFQTVRPYQQNNLFFNFNGEFVASTGYAQIRAKLAYSPEFLYSLIYNSRFLNDVLIRCTGSSYPAINSNDLKKIKIKLPKEIEEQQKIASFLGKVDEWIGNLKEQKENLEKYKKGMMQKIFAQKIRFKDQNGKEFEVWKEKELRYCSEKIWIGLVTTMTTSYEASGTCLIRNQNIRENKIVDNSPIYLNDKFANLYKSRSVRFGDVVTVHTGDVGTSAVIDHKYDGAQGFATLNTRLDLQVLNNFYLSFYFNSKKYKNWALRYSTGDGRNNLNLNDFLKSKIPLPSIKEQQKIAEFLTSIDNLIDSKQEQIAKAEEWKKGLMQGLFV